MRGAATRRVTAHEGRLPEICTALLWRRAADGHMGILVVGFVGMVVIGMLILGLWGGDIGDTRFGIHPRWVGEVGG